MDGAGSSEASSTVALAVTPDASSAGVLLGCSAVEPVSASSDCRAVLLVLSGCCVVFLVSVGLFGASMSIEASAGVVSVPLEMMACPLSSISGLIRMRWKKTWLSCFLRWSGNAI